MNSSSYNAGSPAWVISGMAGRFPESENLEIFWKNLVEGTDMVSENNNRWDLDAYDLPRHMGKIPSIDKFDASFFGVSGTQANKMDPKIRIALEVAFEAIVDAGVNPKSLDGSRVGVFMANSFSEASDIWLRSNESPSGHYISGCHPSMLADRIAYTFNFKGPSCVIDNGCSASFSALQYAMLALKCGICDSAIVGGASINLLPKITHSFFNFNAVTEDGKCKVFDASADGFVRSEAVVALYICPKEKARRSYATILAVKCINDGYKPEGISVPSAEMQAQVMKDVYSAAGVNPLEVSYVECHGTGTKAGDPREIAALAEVFCNGRKKPLLVGSVKSNMGHAEPASGLCGIVKVLLSRRAGILPPNLHFNAPNPDCLPLIDGRIEVATQKSPFLDTFVGITSLGIGGTSAHLVLQFDGTEMKHDDAEEQILGGEGHSTVNRLGHNEGKHKEDSTAKEIPTLILASGRTYDSVEHFLREATKQSSNSDFVGLLHEISKIETARHAFLGYTITKSTTEGELVVSEKPESPKSIWYIFTGLGSQWIGMSNDMIRFKVFKSSIQLSSNFLKKVGIDLKSVLQTEDLLSLNNLQNAFVSIIACQIGLTDLLMSLNITHEGLIGHSLGECTCAYADGCLTQEQTLLIAFYRAKAFMESDLPPGTLASVSLSWEEVRERCSSDIFPAIHNTGNNTTIGGPKESVLKFVNNLKSEGIFAKEVTSAMHAFHTPYVEKSKYLMTKFLRDVIPLPKRRSANWLSSSVPVEDWDSELAAHSSAEYFVNNGIATVKLHDTLQHVPNNCIVLEIGPHCFLQSILKESLRIGSIVVGLMHCKHDNRVFFLKSLGSIYLSGYHFNADALYTPLKLPVSFTTPSICNLIKWDHSLSWDVPQHKNEISARQSPKFPVSLSTDKEYSGHGFNGKVLFPATGYIFLVWKAFAKQQSTNHEQLPVSLENVSFKRMTELHPNVDIEFSINILGESGKFEVTEGEELVCTGYIRRADVYNQEMFKGSMGEKTSKQVLIKEDFYKLLHLRGYDYQGKFRGVRNVNFDGKWAEVEWNDNWICFLDAMLQPLFLTMAFQELVIPVRLNAVTIYPKLFKDHVSEQGANVFVSVCKYLDLVQCPGIQLWGLTPSTMSTSKESTKPTVTIQKFCPFFDPPEVHVTLESALDFFLSIIADNTFATQESQFVFTEIMETFESIKFNFQSAFYLKFESFVHRIVADQPLDNPQIYNNCQIYTDLNDLKPLGKSHLIWSHSLDNIPQCIDLLIDNGFIMLSTYPEEIFPDMKGLALVSSKRNENQTVHLLRKAETDRTNATFLSIDTSDFKWVDTLKENLTHLKEGQKIYILSMSNQSGIIGFTKCLLKEPEGQYLRCIHIQSSLQLDLDAAQLVKDSFLKGDLVFNVYKNMAWGSYANFLMNDFEDKRHSEHVYGDIKYFGNLSSLSWMESPCKIYQRECYNVHFSALNFRDIMYATGKLPKSAFPQEIHGQECILGLEFSGTFRGKRVCGITKGNALGTVLDHHPYLIWEVPHQWSLAEAATVPTVYATAIYSLITRGHLKEKDTVLIHSGSGGVGLAAITIAIGMNCQVFTTVGSQAKRKFIKEMFPCIKDEQILNSKNARSFHEQIIMQTGGKGVDVLLNSLTQEKFIASLHCLAQGGRFLDIGKNDSFQNTSIGLAVLLKSVNIQGIHLDYIMGERSEEGSKLQELVQNFLNAGKIKPLPFTCFDHHELPEAFRYLASRKHVGKVIVKVRDISGIPAILAIPRTYFYEHKTYIVVGGLGGMGLEMVSWMIKRGASKIFIISRSGVSTSYQKFMVQKWSGNGAKVFFKNTNISEGAEVLKLIREAIQEGPLGGVFNLAIVLQDAAFVNQSAEAFQFVSNCKSAATKHFDDLTRIHVPNLDYFVVFSSVACGRGNVGQSNYGHANSVMERICETRRADGLHGLAIQWGPVADVGSIAMLFPEKHVLAGAVGQPISCCIRTLDLLLQQTEAIVSSFYLPKETDKVANTAEVASLAEMVSKILGIYDLKKVDMNATMTEHGMDSIMSTQVRHAILRKKNLFIPVSAYGNLTFKDLIAMDK